MVNSALPKPGPQPELFEEGAKDEGGGGKNFVLDSGGKIFVLPFAGYGRGSFYQI